jgi:hypothetical protein
MSPTAVASKIRSAVFVSFAGLTLMGVTYAAPPGIPVTVENPVTIANPTTSVSVNNTVPVTGNVGIVGTPNVSVTNTVPVTVTNPVGTVNVANTISSPIPVTVTNAGGSNATDTAKTAYVGSAFGSATSTVNLATNISVPFSPLVPSGMRLIIESISGACANIPQATTVYQGASIQTTLYPVAPLAEGDASFILMPQAITTATSTHTEQFSATNLRIYTDAPPILNVSYAATGPGVTYTIPCYFSIFGYLISMP